MTNRLQKLIREKFQRYQDIIPEWQSFVESLMRPLPICIWANTLRTDTTNLEKLLARDGVELQAISWYPWGAYRWNSKTGPGRHWTYWTGLYHVQEEASLIPVLLMNPKSNHRLLDLCAAPGGKSAQMAVRLGNRGSLLANDRNRARMSPLNFMLNRLGLVNVSTTVQDGVNYQRKAGLFDGILVDAPCSCEGTVRKSPEVLNKINEKVYLDQQRIQSLLLEKAVHLCKVGGVIAYSTCTFAPEENECVVQRVLDHFRPSVLKLRKIELPGLIFSKGLSRWKDQQFDSQMENALRLYPHQNDTGGFFVAILEKTAECSSDITLRDREDSTRSLVSPITHYSASIDQNAEEIQRCLTYLISRFGFESSMFESWEMFLRRRKQLYISHSEHRIPSLSSISRSGLMLMKSDIKYPKLSTEAAMLFGEKATKHVVDLSEADMKKYMCREDFEISKEACTGYEEAGYVIVRHRKSGVGVAFIRFEPGAKTARLESLYPKNWYENPR